MNKKIRELAEEAGFILWNKEPWNPGDVIDWSARYDDEFMKYTELVVKECINICEYWDKSVNYTSHGQILADKIKQHFGMDKV